MNRGHHSYKKMEVVSKVGIRGKTPFLSRLQTFKKIFAGYDIVTDIGSVSISGPEVIKLFSCSTQLSMKLSPLINVKMPTIVGILT